MSRYFVSLLLGLLPLVTGCTTLQPLVFGNKARSPEELGARVAEAVMAKDLDTALRRCFVASYGEFLQYTKSRGSKELRQIYESHHTTFVETWHELQGRIDKAGVDRAAVSGVEVELSGLVPEESVDLVVRFQANGRWYSIKSEECVYHGGAWFAWNFDN